MSEKATVLFVDDEERILRSLKSMFRTEYNVLTTTSGHEALGMIRNQRVHVVVSDQRMPVMLGVDLLREVKNISPISMRILLTGYADKEAVIGSINEGEIYRYVSKPWCADDIRNAVYNAAEIAKKSEKMIFNSESITGKELIMVLDEDPGVAGFISQSVASEFSNRYDVEWVTSLEKAMNVLDRKAVAVIVTELNLAGDDIGMFIKSLKMHAPDIITIVTSSFQDINTLVGLINEGQIFRFLPKPLRHGMLCMALNGAFRRYQAIKECPSLLSRHKVEVPKPSSIVEGTLAWRIKDMIGNMYRKKSAVA